MQKNIIWKFRLKQIDHQIFKKQSFADEGSLLLQKKNITEYDMSHT